MTGSYEALGLVFTVSTTDPEAARHVEEALGGLVRSDSEPVTTFTLDPGSESVADAVAGLVGNINLHAVEAGVGNLLLHAGALSRPGGESVLICGPSGSGKSTLTAVLAGRGHAYLTDETACLHPESLTLTPFRKPLALKRGSHSVLGHLRPPWQAEQPAAAWLVPPDALGGRHPPDGPLFPVLGVFPTFVEGSETRVEELSEAEAAYAFGSNASQLWAVDGGALPALARLARRCPSLRITYGDVQDAVRQVEKRWDTA